MKHNITLNSLTFKLRPIDNADAEFVVGLRSDDQLERLLSSLPERSTGSSASAAYDSGCEMGRSLSKMKGLVAETRGAERAAEQIHAMNQQRLAGGGLR